MKLAIKRLYLLFIIANLVLFGGYSIIKNLQMEDETLIIREYYPDISKIEKVNLLPVTYKAYKTGSNQFDYYITFTEEVGYQSKIRVMTSISSLGVVEDVHIASHGETPAFFDKLIAMKFTEQFIGLNILEPIYLNNAEQYSGSSENIMTENKVDAVSGSTISSAAISKAINSGTIYVAFKNFNQIVHNPYKKLKVGKSELALMVIYAVALASIFIKKINKYRKFILLYTAVVIGFYVNKFITFGTLYSLVNGSWPGITNIGWYLLVFGTFALIAISGKNLYCIWICPFGATQEVILKFGGLQQIKLNSKVIKLFKLIPPTLIYISLMIVFFSGETHALAYDPFGAIFNLTALPIMWKTLPFLMFISLVQYRFYCNYFCPVGYILNLVTKLRNKGVKLWKNKITITQKMRKNA